MLSELSRADPKRRKVAAGLVLHARERLGLSQYALAERLGVHWVTVCTWETERHSPSNATLQVIAALVEETSHD